MDKIKWIIFAALSVSVLVFLVIFSEGSKIDTSSININAVQKASQQNGKIADHIFGKTDSKVTLIEYADFQCPGCGSEYVKLQPILEEYKDRIRFIFRNFPLTTMHPNAKAASAAAEAAGLQGKYWEMHDKIYLNQSEWSDLSETQRVKLFADYAKDLGLNIKKFNSDITSEAISKKIAFDVALGQKAGVEGTPTFKLNGKNVDSAIWGDSTKFKAAINKELSNN